MAEIEYKFISDAVEDDYFTVVSFEGVEGLSRLYEYTIELKASIDRQPAETFLDDMLDGEPCFIMTYKDVEYPVYGMLAEFNEKQTAAGYTYYTAVLVPRLWGLNLNRDSRVYLDMTVWDIVENTLNDYQLDYQAGSVDTAVLLEKEYRCQFNETDFDYISRLLENEGIYYYFDQSEGVDTIVFSNAEAGDDAFPDTLSYDARPPVSKVFESVNSWVCRRKRLPQKVVIENYNYETPSDEFIGEFDVSDYVDGEQYYYGENVADASEAEYIAEIRAEEIRARQTQYHGESGVCAFHAGFTFSMEDHANDLYNGVDFLITEIHHQGLFLDSTLQSGSISAGRGIKNRLAQQQEEESSQPQYKNSFTAIAADIQYRPQRLTSTPKFHGTISAFVYAASETNEAEMDVDGRYKVTLPFRRAERDETERASSWIRMARPYAGLYEEDRPDGENRTFNEGLSYPLMANTEVLLTFINGDPDRPVITSAIPNAATPSNLTSENDNQSVFISHSMYVEENRGGSRRIDEVKNWTRVDSEFEFYQTVNHGGDNAVQYQTDANAPLPLDDGKNRITMQFGDQYNYIEGNIYTWGADFVVGFGNDYEEVHESDDPEQYNNQFFDMTPLMQSLGTQLKIYNFKTDAEEQHDYSEWVDGQDGLTEKNWGDKCEYHFGRMFAWSGGVGPGGSLQTYNYGNGYTENLLETDAGTSADLADDQTKHMDDYTSYSQIDPAIATIEKTFGATYGYQNGFSLDIKVGDSHSKTYGDSNDYVDGDSTEEVHGKSTSTVYGNSEETVRGNSQSNVWGRADEQFMGGKSSLSLAATIEINSGVTTEVFAGAKAEMALAASIEIVTGAKAEVDTAVEMKQVAAKLEAVAAKIQKAEVMIVSSPVKLANYATAKISKQLFDIDLSDLTIM